MENENDLFDGDERLNAHFALAEKLFLDMLSKNEWPYMEDDPKDKTPS